MFYRASDPVGGYLEFNEGFYLLNAVRDLGRGLFAPVISPLDANNPFVYPWLLALAVRSFGVSTLVARGLSIVASVASVLLTFALGRQLYNDRIAAFAAVLTALTPGFVLVGRNVQIDGVALAIELGALYAFVRARKDHSRPWAIAAGALLGIGLLTKLPIALVVPTVVAWETWRSGNPAWMRDRLVWWWAGIAAAVPVSWYALRAIASRGGSLAAQTAIIAAAGSRNGLAQLPRMVFGEEVWIFTPLLAAAVLVGIVVCIRKRTPADLFVISYLGVHAATYLVFNYHSYYFLPLVPIGAIAAARGVWGLGARTAVSLAVACALAAALLVPTSLYMLADKKWTIQDHRQIVSAIRDAGLNPADTTVLVDPFEWGSFGPGIEYTLRQGGVHDVVDTSVATTPTTTSVVLLAPARTSAPNLRVLSGLTLDVRAPILFGWVLRPPPPFDHGAFRLPWPQIERVAPFWRFGVETRPWIDQRSVFEVSKPGP